jgi:hypothetical protein
MLGNTDMNQEASGTSWQPQLTPMQGWHGMNGPWMFMAHGAATGVFDHQGGPRGDQTFFGTSMAMGSAWREFDQTKIGFRGMMTLEPLTVPKNGYPLLFQSGETADGINPLIDHQHPHDLFMELATTYSILMSDSQSIFMYVGYPGEPALGPPVFMHRFSGEEIVEAPISHHWIDSTHVTFGVVTFGYIWDKIKIEASTFTGREPDQHRYNFDTPRLNSYSGRFSFNPTSAWALQASYGHIVSPDQLAPMINADRITASAMYDRSFNHGDWQTTFVWGQDIGSPGSRLNAYLLESTINVATRHWFFGRFEQVDKDELFDFSYTISGVKSPVSLSASPNAHSIPFNTTPESHDPLVRPHPLRGRPFTIQKLSVGYTCDVMKLDHATLGIGGLASFYFLPDEISQDNSVFTGGGQPGHYYGESQRSYMIFARAKFQ